MESGDEVISAIGWGRNLETQNRTMDAMVRSLSNYSINTGAW